LCVTRVFANPVTYIYIRGKMWTDTDRQMAFCLYIVDIYIYIYISRLTGSESWGQEEAACARPANTTGVLFTSTNTVKFPSAVTRSSCTLPLSYYRDSTFLPCRISKPKINELGATIVMNQPFQLLWHPYPYLRLKLDCLEHN